VFFYVNGDPIRMIFLYIKTISVWQSDKWHKGGHIRPRHLLRLLQIKQITHDSIWNQRRNLTRIR
jgi:hypothetical protein